MNVHRPAFELSHVVWKEARMSSAGSIIAVLLALQEFDAECSECGRNWHARPSRSAGVPGHFYVTPGHVTITCPEETCGLHATLPNPPLPGRAHAPMENKPRLQQAG